MAFSRTTYTGPVKNRGKVGGKIDVSREELADFRRKHGADKTLRDLLNADKTGKTPASEKSPLARGPQGANIEPSRVSMSPARREAMDRASENARKREESKKAVMDRQGAAASRGMERLKAAGLTPGSTTLGQSLGAAATMAAPGAAKPLAKVAGRAITGAMGRAASEGTKRITPMLATSRNAATGKFRNTQGSLKESTEAAMKSRPGPEMGAGAKSGRAASESGRVEPMLSTGRVPGSGKFRRSEVSLREATEAAKSGRTEPTFKKGGSVKGGGCETRGKKTRYV